MASAGNNLSVTPAGGSTTRTLSYWINALLNPYSMTVNGNPFGGAPAYTTSFTSDFVVGNSSTTVLSQWAILDGGTGHDGISSVMQIIPGTTATQVNAISGYIDNYNSNNVTSSVGVGAAIGAFCSRHGREARKSSRKTRSLRLQAGE